MVSDIRDGAQETFSNPTHMLNTSTPPIRNSSFQDFYDSESSIVMIQRSNSHIIHDPNSNSSLSLFWQFPHPPSLWQYATQSCPTTICNKQQSVDASNSIHWDRCTMERHWQQMIPAGEINVEGVLASCEMANVTFFVEDDCVLPNDMTSAIDKGKLNLGRD